MQEDGSMRDMTYDDLEMVLAWRNHHDIREYMYTKREISLAEHKHWFEQAIHDPRRHLLIFEHDRIPRGFVSFQRSSECNTVEWGFYTAPDAPKGCGYRLGRAALKHAFEDLDVHKICGQALAYNKRSIAFHQRLGFQQEGILSDQHFDGQTYHHVLCFGLLASEWETINT